MTIDWNHFTPWTSLAGGMLLGLAASALVLLRGRILGISTILGGMLRATTGERGWRIAFLAGLLAAPVLYGLAGGPVTMRIDATASSIAAAGLLVGLGSRFGGGCTSGHGVCGLARLSPRSLVATLSFMVAGFATVFLTHHVLR